MQFSGLTAGTRPGDVPPGLGRKGTVTGHKQRRKERDPRSLLEVRQLGVTSEHLTLKHLRSPILYLKNGINGIFCATKITLVDGQGCLS